MADDAAFQEAVEALRAGNKTKARELFTGLVKTDQNNVTYWIWLSAAMETIVRSKQFREIRGKEMASEE